MITIETSWGAYLNPYHIAAKDNFIRLDGVWGETKVPYANADEAEEAYAGIMRAIRHGVNYVYIGGEEKKAKPPAWEKQ